MALRVTRPTAAPVDPREAAASALFREDLAAYRALFAGGGDTGAAAPPGPDTVASAFAPRPAYSMLGVDGKVYAFGSAAAWVDQTSLEETKVSIAPTPDNKSYWIVTTTC